MRPAGRGACKIHDRTFAAFLCLRRDVETAVFRYGCVFKTSSANNIRRLSLVD